MNPAFPYTGLKLRLGTVTDKRNVVIEPGINPGDQFAREIDHMARCVIDDAVPHTPSEEDLQDMGLMEAIYRSAASGRAVRVEAPTGPPRGPEPNPVDVT